MGLHAAINLYNDRKYMDAYNLCIKLLDEQSFGKEEKLDVLLLMEKSAISSSVELLTKVIIHAPWNDGAPNIEEYSIPGIITPPLDMMLTLLNTVDDIARVFSLDAEIKGHLNHEKKNAICHILNSIEMESGVKCSKVSLCVWKICFAINLAFIDSMEFNHMLQTAFPHLETSKDLRIYKDEQGLLHPTFSYDDDDQATDVYSSVERYFSKVVAYHNNNYITANKEHSLTVGRTLNRALAACANLLKREKDISPSLQLSNLRLLAKIKTYGLTACLKVGNTILSLNNSASQRKDMLKELREVYDKIQQIDPTFQVPSLPEEEPTNQRISNGGCYVATAVYGSYDCPQVWTLRRYRDYTLAETWYGRAFIKTYYAISPTLVKWFGHTEWFKKMWQGKLDRMVAKLQAEGVESTPYEDKEWK